MSTDNRYIKIVNDYRAPEDNEFFFSQDPHNIYGMKKLFDYLDDDKNLVFENEPINKLVNEKELMMFKHNGFWHPMDTRREHQILNELLINKKAPWIKW